MVGRDSVEPLQVYTEWQAATAFAPASVGNVGVGFDILGHTVAAIGDRVPEVPAATGRHGWNARR